MNLSNRFGVVNPETGQREQHGPGEREYPEWVARSLGLTPLPPAVVDDLQRMNDASRVTQPDTAGVIPDGWPNARAHKALLEAGLRLPDLQSLTVTELQDIDGIGAASAHAIHSDLHDSED